MIQDIGIAKEITLLLDTGAESTIISEGDAKEMNLDYSTLEKGPPALGIGGTAEIYVVRGAALSFVSDGWLIVKTLDRLEVIKHNAKDPILQKALESSPNLLGCPVTADGNNNVEREE